MNNLSKKKKINLIIITIIGILLIFLIILYIFILHKDYKVVDDFFFISEQFTRNTELTKENLTLAKDGYFSYLDASGNSINNLDKCEEYTVKNNQIILTCDNHKKEYKKKINIVSYKYNELVLKIDDEYKTFINRNLTFKNSKTKLNGIFNISDDEDITPVAFKNVNLVSDNLLVVTKNDDTTFESEYKIIKDTKHEDVEYIEFKINNAKNYFTILDDYTIFYAGNTYVKDVVYEDE